MYVLQKGGTLKMWPGHNLGQAVEAYLEETAEGPTGVWQEFTTMVENCIPLWKYIFAVREPVIRIAEAWETEECPYGDNKGRDGEGDPPAFKAASSLWSWCVTQFQTDFDGAMIEALLGETETPLTAQVALAPFLKEQGLYIGIVHPVNTD